MKPIQEQDVKVDVMRSICPRPAMLRVAEALRSAECARVAGVGFNMCSVTPIYDAKDYSGHHCETVCCIDGWAQQLGVLAQFHQEQKQPNGEFKREYFELTMPFRYMSRAHEFPLPRAAAVVAHAAWTGEVCWERFDMDGKEIVR